jgi:hypothetical protein
MQPELKGVATRLRKTTTKAALRERKLQQRK